jgi:hypothetical protein
LADELLPKKKAPASSKKGSATAGASPPMRRLMRIARVVGILFGGSVALVGVMSLVGLITDNFFVRFILGLILVVGFPAFIADRFLKRANLKGGLTMVADVFAILLLGFALVIVAADAITRPLLVREGDRYARSGSRGTARLVYFLGGVSPTFPDEKPAAPASSASASPSGSAGAPR